MPVNRLGFSAVCAALSKIVSAKETTGSSRMASATVEIQDYDSFAALHGLDPRFRPLREFPVVSNNILVCHPVSDAAEHRVGDPLPLKEYLKRLRIVRDSHSGLDASASPMVSKILLPLAEVGHYGVNIGGCRMPILSSISKMTGWRRAHWTLLEINMDGGKVNVVVHDSKGYISSGVVVTEGVYPVKSYIQQQFDDEIARSVLSSILGGKVDDFKKPNIVVNAYGAQAVADETECGYHTLITTLAITQGQSYSEVLSNCGGTIQEFSDQLFGKSAEKCVGRVVETDATKTDAAKDDEFIVDDFAIDELEFGADVTVLQNKDEVEVVTEKQKYSSTPRV